MMNKKILALFVAIATVSTSMFAFLDDVVGGTFSAAERVATVPVDATGAAIDRDGKTWSERREERRQERADRRADRQDRREQRRGKTSSQHYDGATE